MNSEPAVPIRRLRRCALLTALACLLAPVTGSAQPTYYRDGRLVGMGQGGRQVFFNYYNVRHDAIRPLVMTPAQGILEAMRTAGGLRDVLQLDITRRRIVDNSLVQSTTARSLGMTASYRSGRYQISVSDEAAFFLSGMAMALVDSGRHQDLGYFNLFIMSEMDWFRQRSPRWYRAATYSTFKGYSEPADMSGIHTQYDGMTAVLVLTVMMHEFCHHFRGHTTAGARELAELRRRGRMREALQLMGRNEAEADACAVELTARAGVPPGFAMTASLAISVVMGHDPSSIHPPSAERIRRARQLDDQALADAAGRNRFPAELAGRIHELNDGLLEMLNDYHRRYN